MISQNDSMTKTKKISFLQVDHHLDDDRVWHHQSKLLKDNNFDISVISTRTDSSDLENVFCFDDMKMKKTDVCKKISKIFNQIEPNIIICDNPLAVYFASRYKKKYHQKTKIVMDVTEWYPSKKNLAHLIGFKRFIKKIILKCLNFYTGFLVDGFIFGEYHKAKSFKKYFKKKRHIDLPYYPDLKYISQGKAKNDFSTWNFLYSGQLTKEKGSDNLFNAIKFIALENRSCNFILNIISNNASNEKYTSKKIEIPDNVKIKIQSYLPFEKYCNEIANYDIFFDLREKDKENNHCLPIKLFYYMACGRPIIFSDLEAINLQVAEINEFAYLTNPDDFTNISRAVTTYITNKDKYYEHSAAALKYSKEKYNWEMLSDKFLKFIVDVLD